MRVVVPSQGAPRVNEHREELVHPRTILSHELESVLVSFFRYEEILLQNQGGKGAGGAMPLRARVFLLTFICVFSSCTLHRAGLAALRREKRMPQLQLVHVLRVCMYVVCTSYVCMFHMLHSTTFESCEAQTHQLLLWWTLKNEPTMAADTIATSGGEGAYDMHI